MKEQRPELATPAQGVISYDARIAADNDMSVSSYASTISSVPIESLEVHGQTASASIVAPPSPSKPKISFSRSKAAVISAAITIIVVLITVGGMVLINRETSQNANSANSLNVASQDVALKNQANATVPSELQGVGNAVLINGDLITRGQIKVTNGAYVTLLRSATLTANQSVTLPNGSGTLCLDSNNCQYATAAQLQQLQSQLGQVIIPDVPAATTVNGANGAVSIQGTSNQINVSTVNGIVALSTPQDLAPLSSPTFAGMILNGNFSLSGTLTLPLNCSGMLNGGTLTTNASGQVICSADDASGGGGASVTTPGGTAGNLALFTAADTIADSIISQALGTITISGNAIVSGSLSANSLTLATALSVANGGTGSTTFTTNGVLLGNGTGAVISTTAPTSGQLLLGNGSNVPTFTTISGDVAITGAGVTSIQADSIALGVDTTGNYVANLGTLTGLTTSGNTGEGSTPSLSVVYGSSANTAVQGNTSITVTAGTNLSGGGSVTLGSGGSVSLSVSNSPTFSGNIIAQGGTVTIGSTSQVGYTVLHDGNGQIGSLTTTDLTSGRTYTFPDATGVVCLNSGNCVGGTGGAPNGATFLTIGNDATLNNERAITAGNNIGFTDGGANGNFTISTVNNPSFTTSVTTPLLQSSGALSITPSGALTVGATGQTALLQGSTTTIASNGAGNDIVLTSADQITLTGFNCTTFTNGGVLTTDASGNLTCANDDGGAGGAITGTGNANRIALFTGAQTVADSWLLQNGSTLEIDNTRNLSLTGGNLGVTGTGTFSGLLTANGGLTIESGDTFTMNGDAFTDLTGTGLVISSGSLQTSLGTSVDLAAEVNGVLPVANGGTGVNGSAAANGQLLIGNGSGYTLATLTQGDGITITNASGGITVASAFGTSVDLGVDTTGNYQIGTAAGNGIAVTGTAGAGWTPTIALAALTADWSQTGAFDLVLNNANSELRVLESVGGTFFGSIDVGNLTADRTYTFPDASGTICLDTGNCAGAGGGITGAGTSDTIAKFTGGGTVGDSSITDDGTDVTLTGSVNLVIQGGNATLGTTTQSGTLTLSDGSSNAVSIVTAAFAGNQTYTLPDVGSAATFCMSTGNCLGSGGGGAPNDAAYLVASLSGTLSSERALTAGTNIGFTDAGANGNFTVATVNNPTFSTSVTTPQLQSSGALTLVSAAGETIAVDAGTTIELQDSTNITGSLDVSSALNVGTSNAFQISSAGAITAATGITSSGSIRFSGFNCTTFTNGGVLTTDASGNLTCANDDGGAGGAITGNGTNGTIALFTGTNTIADSIVTQSGTTVNIAGDLTLDTALAVAEGGTGAASFTTNGVLYGNNTGTLQVTAAGTSGQVLVANGSGVPTFVSFSGDVTVAASGATTIAANSVALGTDTTGDYVANLGTLTGLTTGGNTGEGSTPSLSVTYGSGANTAVQGNTTLTCPSGTGNLSGGGTTITLGTGGACSAIDTVNNPTFSTSVTTPSLTSTGALSITPGGALTVGATGQAFTLQGNASSTITATGGGFTTTIGFTGTPVGAVTYNFDRTAVAGTYAICTTAGNCTGSAVTLQSAYNASTNPEIVLDGTRGALTVRDNGTPLGANLLEIQNNAGTATYFGVSATGAGITGNLNITGTGGASDTTLVVRGNGAKGNNDLIADFQSYDGVTTRSILRVTHGAGLYIGNNTGSAASFGISNGTWYGIFQSTNLTAARTFELPNVSGTICTDAGNCGSTTGTLQNAYTYSTGGSTPEIKLDGTRSGLDIQDTDAGLTSTNNFISLRGANAGGLGAMRLGIGIQGNLYMRPAVDRTDVVDINDTDDNNLFTIDSQNNRVGINLGGTVQPSYTLDVSGTANISSSVLVPTIDTATAVAMNIGTTNASAVTVGNAGATLTLQGNASTTMTATGGGFTTTVGFTGTPVGAVRYNFDRAATAGTYTICTTAGNCTGTAVTLQNAYNASTNPEIVLDATRGALTVRDNATPISGNLLEVQNNGGGTTYLGLTTARLTVNTSLSAGAAGTGNIQTSNVSPLSGSVNGNWVNTIATPASDSSANIYNTYSTLTTSGAANFTGDLVGTLSQVSWAGTGASTTGRLVGAIGKVTASGPSGAIQNAVGLQAEGQFQGGAVTNYYGLYSTMNPNNSVAIGTAYGLKIDNFAAIGSAAPTTFYAIAADGGMTRLTGESIHQLQVQNSEFTSVLNVDTTNTNLITNPSFEVDTTGWALKGSATITRTGSQTYDANNSLQVATTASGAGARYTYNLAGSTQYTLSFFAKISSGTFTTLAAGRSDDGSADTACTLSPDTTVLTTHWKRFTCTFTTGSVSGSRYVYITQTDGTARTFFIDGVQLEATATASAYLPGKTSIGGNLVVNGGQAEASVSTHALKVNALSGGSGLLVRGSGHNDLFQSLVDVRSADDSMSFLNVNEVTRSTIVQGGNSFLGTSALEVRALDAGASALVVKATSGQTADIFQVFDAAGSPNKLFNVNMSNVTLGTNHDLIMQGATAYISNPQTQTASEAFGLNATVSAANALAVGNGASANARGVALGSGATVNSANQGAVAIGYNAAATGFGAAVAIGYNAAATGWSIAIGENASINPDNGQDAVTIGTNSVADLQSVSIGTEAQTTDRGIAIGFQASTLAGQNSIAIGHGAATTAADQMVVGSSSYGVTHAIFGSGVTSATPGSFKLQTTSGSGTNIAGGNFTLAAGQGTGSAAGGDINLQVSAPGGSGSGLNALTTVASFSGVNGSALFKNATNSTSAFQIQNSSSTPIINVDTVQDTTNNLIDAVGVCGATPTCGGFENGVGNWVLVNDGNNAGGGTPSVTTTTGQYVWGARSMDMTFNSTGDKVRLPITLTNGQYYTLNFYAKSDLAASGVLNVGYSQNGSTEDVGTLSVSNQSVTNTGWTHYVVSIAPTSVSGSPYIYFKQNSSTLRHIYIDNLVLAQVTAQTQQATPAYKPASIALGGVISTPLVVAPSSNSTAFQVLDDSGATVMNVDTKNNFVGIGTMSPASKLHIASGGTSATSTFSTLRAGATVADSTTGGSNTLNLFSLYNSALSANDLFTVSNGGNVTIAPYAGSSTAFQVQAPAAADTMFSVNTTTRTGGTAGNVVKIGNSTGTDTNLTVLQLDSATANPTTNLTSMNGALFYNSTTNKVNIIENGTVKTLCNTTDLACVNSNNFIQNQNASQQTSSNFWVSGTGRADTSISTPQVTTASGNLTLQSATGVISLGGSDTFTANGGFSVLSGTNSSLTVAANGTGTLNLGTNAVSSRIINIGATGSQANTSTINIGNSTGAAQTVSIGSTNTTSTTTINAGSGGVVINGTGDVTGDFDVNGNLSSGTFSGSGLTDCDATNSKLLWDLGTQTFSCGTDRASVTIRKSADESVTSSTAVQNDNDFFFTAGANETWAFQMFFEVNSSTTADFRTRIDAPAGTTCRVAYNNLFNATNTYTSDCNVAGELINDQGATFDNAYVVYGTVVTGGTGGTIQLRWAQGTSAGTATIVRGGGQMIAYKISGADVAEAYYTKDNTIMPGDVVEVDGSLPAGVKKATGAYTGKALGIISTQPGMVLGDPGHAMSGNKPVLLALNGRVPTKVSMENGPIEAGDYLTTSSTPGVAMKATRPGPTIGKALESYSGDGNGTVLAFVDLGYYNPAGGLQGSAEYQELNIMGTATMRNLVVEDAIINNSLTVKGTLKVVGLTDLAKIRVNGHIVTAGGAPEITVQAAAGQGATVIISGNDTAGRIEIKTGASPAADALAKILFSQAFTDTPQVVITPVGKQGATAQAYIDGIDKNGFMLGASQPAPNTTYIFTYHVLSSEQ
jgi:hypothetical protein